MKKLLTILFILLLSLYLTSCKVEKNEYFSCDLYYGYYLESATKVYYNDTIELLYLSDSNGYYQIPLNFTFNANYNNKIEKFMSTPENKTEIKSLMVNIYCDSNLMDTIEFADFPNEQIQEERNSSFWNSYKITSFNYKSVIDYKFTSGKYKIEFTLEVIYDEQLLKCSDAINFEIIGEFKE